MCDPTGGIATMAALTVASTGLTMYGQAKSSKANQAAYAQASQLAMFNAKTEDVAAADALARGEEEAIAHGRQVAALRGTQTASMAAEGLELGFGSALDVETDTDLLAAEDANRIRQNASREADSHRISAVNYRAEAAGATAARKAEKSSMLINAGSTLLSGASQIAGLQMKYGKK